jgi:hypothetical protein
MARPVGSKDSFYGDWHEAFLTVLRKTSDVRKAARDAGVSKQAAYQARDKDPEFAEKWQDALDEGLDNLENVARKRALKSSDTLLIFLLKSHRPEVYGDRSQVNMNVQGRVTHTHRIDLSRLTDEELDQLELIVGKAGTNGGNGGGTRLLPEGDTGQFALPAGYTD